MMRRMNEKIRMIAKNDDDFEDGNEDMDDNNFSHEEYDNNFEDTIECIHLMYNTTIGM